MPTLFFVIAGLIGLGLTRFAFWRVMNRSSSTNHQKAFVMAIGFGLTILASTFAVFLAPGTNIQLETPLVLLFVANSAFVTFLTYGAARTVFYLKS